MCAEHVDPTRTTIAGRFSLGGLIGGGAVGRVFVGFDALTGEKVAIKALRPEIVAQNPELIERFRREGEALRRLNHPNIVKVLATVQEGDLHYLVLEYIGGGSLADLLARQKMLPVERVVAIALELSDALSRAHHLDILHRDIKPANILISEDGSPHLTDFGLARLGSAAAMTQIGSILGTIPYLSPEACYNQKLDPATDIWSLGIVLFEMLTGELPFTGETPLDIIRAIHNDPLPDPAWKRSDLPPSLVDLLRKMLMKDRPVRISSARLLGAELEKIQGALKAGAGAEQKQDRSPAPAPPSSPAPAKICVLIVDDHAVVRQGLRTFIDMQDDLQVVGEGENGLQAVELCERLHPDVVLLDLVMPHMDGVEATRRIKECCPGTKVLILTSFGENDKVFPAIRAGAQGYLLKDIHPNELIQAIRKAQRDEVQLHPDIARKLMEVVAAAPPKEETSSETVTPPSSDHALAAKDLTEREREVLDLIARGLSNHDIAEKMVISEKTVKSHVSNLLGKLGLEDRTQAAIWALKNGLGAVE